MVRKDVFKTDVGVKIKFTGIVEKQQIVKMVENCAKGQCDCMSDETKSKITAMDIDGQDGDINLNISGDLAKEEIENALAKSKILKSKES